MAILRRRCGTSRGLSKLAMEMLRDIDEETVDFSPNYDGYEMEPSVLPSRFPNCWSTAPVA